MIPAESKENKTNAVVAPNKIAKLCFRSKRSYCIITVAINTNIAPNTLN